MTISSFFKDTPLERSLVIGFYGGGNFGDELLLEVIQAFFHQRQVKQLHIYHQHPETFSTYHRDYGYSLVDARNKVALLKKVWRSKNLLVGGGGLWGMDVNTNILLLGMLLLAARLLGKNVYLIGIGYYNSTTTLGRISAWLAGKAATHIIARDQETYENFASLNQHTSLDTDLAFYIPQLHLKTVLHDTRFPLKAPRTKTVIVTLRRFNDNRGDMYPAHLYQLMATNPHQKFLALLMEPRSVDPRGFAFLKKLGKLPNVQYHDFSYNPLALLQFLVQYHNRLAVIAPQYHVIISALIAEVRFFPLIYDNKVRQILMAHQVKPLVEIRDLEYKQLQTFIDKW